MTDLLAWSPYRIPAILVPKASLDELFAVLDEEVPYRLLTNRGDLD